MFGGSFGKTPTASPVASPVRQTNVPQNPNDDFEVPEVSPDGISSLSFSPVTDHFAATSWDCSVRVWEYSAQKAMFGAASQGSVQCAPKALQTHSEPVLCSTFSRDGLGVFFGGTDGQVKLWDLASNQVQQVAQHEHGVKECAFVPELNFLLTGSWDKRLCYWDCRSPNPSFVHSLPDRINAMDVKGQLLVVGTSGRKIEIFDLRSPGKVASSIESPLKWQTRCIACFNDEKGYFIGSIEGRCAVQNIEAGNTQKNFTFKCHRQGEPRTQQEVFAINAIKVHPTFGTFITCGSDGTICFWDKERKRRLKSIAQCADSISSAAFSKEGSFVAYAVSYDWRFGVEGYNPDTMRSSIFLHQVQDDEVRTAQTSLAPNQRRR